MKLLLILPNLLLIAVSGINLANELSATQLNKNLAVIALHGCVLIMCLVFVALIVKSMFRIVEIEHTSYAEDNGYEEINLRHTIRL
jgi:hypothetical protein